MAIQPREYLGREVLDRRSARKILRQDRVPAGVFADKRSQRWSVDRLCLAPIECLVPIGDENARARGENRTFYGWAAVLAEEITLQGRTTEATRRLNNRYHADIVLPDWPDDLEEREDICLEHAADLATATRFFVDLERA